MRGRRWLPPLFALLLAGCAGPVEQAPGSIAPGHETFFLTVQVVSATLPGVPVAGASVSAGDAAGNLTRGVTDASGVVRLELRAPQVVAIEVSADGFAGAGSVPLRLGNGTIGEFTTQIGAAFVCAFSFGLACPVDATTTLGGFEGQIALKLVPAKLERVVEVPVDRHVSSDATGHWASIQPVPFTGDATLDAIYGAQLKHVEGKLAWTNEPGAQADLGFGLACGEMIHEGVRTPATGPTSLLAMGPRELTLSYSTPGPCAPLNVLAIVDSASTALIAQASLTLHFGPGVQRV